MCCNVVKLLVAYISVPRYEGPEYDQAMVQKDAEALYKAGEKKLGTDEKVFIQIFSERSRAHLVAVGSAYQSLYGHSLEKVPLTLTLSLLQSIYISFA